MKANDVMKKCPNMIMNGEFVKTAKPAIAPSQTIIADMTVEKIIPVVNHEIQNAE